MVVNPDVQDLDNHCAVRWMACRCRTNAFMDPSKPIKPLFVANKGKKRKPFYENVPKDSILSVNEIQINKNDHRISYESLKDIAADPRCMFNWPPTSATT